jgi:hypothetical protein
VELRRPLGVFCALGSLAWPVGVFGFGGFDDDAGTVIVGVGSFVVLVSIAVELLLRGRDRRQARAASR